MPKETNQPLLSVIMPCYKMGQFIGEALESVGKQTYTNWEVIAVDDCGPEDGTKEAVEVFAKQFSNHRILYHRHEKNGGVSAARNTAIGLAQGEYLAFLDPDDWWEKLHLFIHVNEHMNNKNVNILTASRIAFVSCEDGNIIGSQFANKIESETFPSCLGVRNPINPSSVVLYKENLVDAGLFDTNPNIQHVEDWDLWIRMSKLKIKFIFINQNTVFGGRHNLNATADIPKMESRILDLLRKHNDFMTLRNIEYTNIIHNYTNSYEKRIDYLQELILKNPFYKIGRIINKILKLE